MTDIVKEQIKKIFNYMRNAEKYSALYVYGDCLTTSDAVLEIAVEPVNPNEEDFGDLLEFVGNVTNDNYDVVFTNYGLKQSVLDAIHKGVKYNVTGKVDNQS